MHTIDRKAVERPGLALLETVPDGALQGPAGFVQLRRWRRAWCRGGARQRRVRRLGCQCRRCMVARQLQPHRPGQHLLRRRLPPIRAGAGSVHIAACPGA